eukprot:897788-Pleurochrysis_carterae.AAC.1
MILLAAVLLFLFRLVRTHVRYASVAKTSYSVSDPCGDEHMWLEVSDEHMWLTSHSVSDGPFPFTHAGRFGCCRDRR